MPDNNPIAANAALWTRYLEDSWERALDPLGQRYVARAAGTAIAAWLSLVQEPQIDWLFGSNAPAVSRFVEQVREERETVNVPAELRAFRQPVMPAPTGPAPWLDALRERERTRASVTTLVR